jgi:large subunit ribosomal protein L29
MRAKELRERNPEELRQLQDEAQDQLFRARLQNATHQLDKTSDIRKARREVARIKTVLAERDQAAESTDAADKQEE